MEDRPLYPILRRQYDSATGRGDPFVDQCKRLSLSVSRAVESTTNVNLWLICPHSIKDFIIGDIFQQFNESDRDGLPVIDDLVRIPFGDHQYKGSEHLWSADYNVVSKYRLSETAASIVPLLMEYATSCDELQQVADMHDTEKYPNAAAQPPEHVIDQSYCDSTAIAPGLSQFMHKTKKSLLIIRHVTPDMDTHIASSQFGCNCDFSFTEEDNQMYLIARMLNRGNTSLR